MSSFTSFLFGTKHSSSPNGGLPPLPPAETSLEVRKPSEEREKIASRRISLHRRSTGGAPGSGFGIVGQMQAEHVQISQLFKRVRVFVKNNPVPLTSSTSDDEELAPIPPVQPLQDALKKRPSGDIEVLADNFREKCRCIAEDDDDDDE